MLNRQKEFTAVRNALEGLVKLPLLNLLNEICILSKLDHGFYFSFYFHCMHKHLGHGLYETNKDVKTELQCK